MQWADVTDSRSTPSLSNRASAGSFTTRSLAAWSETTVTTESSTLHGSTMLGSP